MTGISGLSDLSLFVERNRVGDDWINAASGETLTVEAPAIGVSIGTIPRL